MRASLWTVPALVVLMSFGLVACKDDDPCEGDTCEDAVEDTGGDGGGDVSDADASGELGEGDGDAEVDEEPPPTGDVWPTVARTPDEADIDPMGFDPADDPAAGEARAGVVRAGDDGDFGGPDAACRPGDFVLQNENLRACIAGPREQNQFFFTGGHLLDIEAERGSGDYIELITPLVALLQCTGDEVRIASDGGGADTAVVRVSGIDLPMKLIVGTLGTDVITPPVGLRTETEYRLAPGAEYIEVVTWVETAISSVRRVEAGDVFLTGDQEEDFFPGYGFGRPAGGSTPFFAAIGPGRSYGVYSEDMEPNQFDVGDLTAGILITNMTVGNIGTASEAVFRRYIAVGDGGSTEVREKLSDVMGAAEGSVVNFTTPTGEFWDRPQWVIADTNGVPVAVIVADDDGSAAATLADGSYTATAMNWPAGDAPIEPFTVPATNAVELSAPVPAVIVVDATDGADGSGLTVHVDVTGPVNRRIPVLRGSDRIALPAGTYSLVVDHGEAYENYTDTIELVAGEELQLPVTLNRVFETGDWVSGDFHLHSMKSSDSEVPNVDRVLSNLATGLDFLAPTDHDSISDFAAVVAGMGVADLIELVQGTEISPLRGHMNAFPTPYAPEVEGTGAIQLAERDGLTRNTRQLDQPELVQLARDRGAEVVQINHARGPGLALFAHVGFDRVTGGPTTRRNQWVENFEAMEVYNERDDFCELARDWMALNNHGRRVTGTGTSDTHTLGNPAGFPRSYVHVGETASAADFDVSDIMDAVKDGRVIVSGGLLITLGADMPGDIRSESAGTVSFDVKVESPSWAVAEELIVYVNGVEDQRIALTADAADLVDFDDTVEVDVSVDSQIVFMAFSDTAMVEVNRGDLPFGFTNPVYIDIDGDGWTAPGVPDTDIPEMVTPFCD